MQRPVWFLYRFSSTFDSTKSSKSEAPSPYERGNSQTNRLFFVSGGDILNGRLANLYSQMVTF
ncbi:MAG: hypothetical protein HC804_08515 [Anaerolineae bacterium]|nr:hypothetical protein [Anaerolineae bacterium]